MEKDTYGDGTVVCNDHCYMHKNEIEPGGCGCGTIDEDKERNGIMDCIDECPGYMPITGAGICGCGT